MNDEHAQTSAAESKPVVVNVDLKMQGVYVGPALARRIIQPGLQDCACTCDANVGAGAGGGK